MNIFVTFVSLVK